MILLLDAGNTNIKIGLVKEEEILYTWRLATDYNKTADEYGMLLFDLLRQNGLRFNDVEGIIMSSVVPSINFTLEHMFRYYCKVKTIMVTQNIDCGLKFDYKGEQLGSDRIINAAAAYHLYGGPVIVVDFGSATTFGVVDRQGTFIGGAIAPGIKSATEALVNTTAKLPRIELVRPKSVIGKDTVSNMQSGVIFGFTGLVDYIVKSIKEETGFHDAKVIATGGLSLLVKQGVSSIDHVDRALSLKGLKLIYDRNKHLTEVI